MIEKEIPAMSILPRCIPNLEGSLITGHVDHDEVNVIEESMVFDAWKVCLLGLKHHRAERLRAAQAAHNSFAAVDNKLMRMVQSRNMCSLAPKWGDPFIVLRVAHY